MALAEPRLIADPWSLDVPPPQAAAVPIATTPALPASGLDQAPAVPAPASVEAAAQPRPKWSPPVVELLVDPWAQARPTRPRWVPADVEIINPWAEPAPPAPHVARGPVVAGRATIF
jgi:hypothetical protein